MYSAQAVLLKMTMDYAEGSRIERRLEDSQSQIIIITTESSHAPLGPQPDVLTGITPAARLGAPGSCSAQLSCGRMKGLDSDIKALGLIMWVLMSRIRE